MESLSLELAKYGPTGVALAALILTYLIFKAFLNYQQETGRRHERAFSSLTQAINKNAESTDKNTAATQETLQFMRNLNGSLVKAVESKRSR